MIQNLNQVNFQKFGFLFPNQENRDKSGISSQNLVLCAEQSEAVLYRAASDTTLQLSSGKSVLSVSDDNCVFQHFYFDKPVCIKTDTYFYLSPFMGDAAIILHAAAAPEIAGSRASDNLRIDRQLHIDGIYTFFYQEREQSFIFPGEAHPMLELTYVDQGNLHSVADGLDLTLNKGDIAVYGPHQWHMQYADMGIAPRFVTISFDLTGIDITPLLNRKFTATQKAVSLIQQMLQEQERMDEYSADMMLSHLSALVLTLLRHADAPEGKLKASNSLHSENELIRAAQQYISTHIRQKLTVPLVAQSVDISPSYLTALFHKNLQISPGEYIRRVKLQEGKQMIRENSMNFTQIAAALQYSTVHHFSRQFKEKFGITPSEYARSVR